jgi:molecular chaperone GrpE
MAKKRKRKNEGDLKALPSQSHDNQTAKNNSPVATDLHAEHHLQELLAIVESVPELFFLREKLLELKEKFDLKSFLGCYHLAIMTLKDLLDKKKSDVEKLKVCLEEFSVPTKTIQPVSDARLDALAQKLKEQEEMLHGIEIQYERLREDFEGYKKRAERRIEETVQLAKEKFVLKFLPILDNFERALAFKGPLEPLSILKGVEMIKKQMEEVFEKEGIVPIQAEGKIFDPSLHEAAESVYTLDFPEDTVVEELRKGYKYKEKVIRPALVKIAKASVLNHKEEQSSDGKDSGN